MFVKGDILRCLDAVPWFTVVEVVEAEPGFWITVPKGAKAEGARGAAVIDAGRDGGVCLCGIVDVVERGIRGQWWFW